MSVASPVRPDLGQAFPPPAPEKKKSNAVKITAIIVGGIVALAVIGSLLDTGSVPSGTGTTLEPAGAVVEAPGIEEAVDGWISESGVGPSEFCTSYDSIVELTGSDAMAWSSFNEGAGPGDFEGGFSNREVYDELASRC